MNAIIYLNYKDRNIDNLFENIKNAGKHIDIVTIVNEEGIAFATNKGLRNLNFDNIDYVTIMGNDILEPNNWLQIRNDFLQDKTIGICSIPLHSMNNDTADLTGNFTITKETIKRVGAFNQELDPYGAIDLDYCTRCRAAGLHTKFIKEYTANHIEQNSIDAYGYNKNELVQKTWSLHSNNVSAYTNGNKTYYINL
jgi:GT2 family glycosyltransferase